MIQTESAAHYVGLALAGLATLYERPKDQIAVDVPPDMTAALLWIMAQTLQHATPE